MQQYLPANPDIKRQLKSRLLSMTPRAFELFAGELLVYVGLQNAAVTRYVGDGGIDAHGDLVTGSGIIRIPTGVQVKRYRQNVQRSDIDRFIGALSGRFSQGILITTAGYAQQALTKAASSIPRVSTVNGEQVVTMMLRYSLGITLHPNHEPELDDEYFLGFEVQTSLVRERTKSYRTGASIDLNQPPSESHAIEVQSEDDMISLRALSYALRVDTKTIRFWIEQDKLQPDAHLSLPSREGFYFRRDRIEQIRQQFARTMPETNAEWRQEFLDFARSRNLTKSYKPVLIKAILKLVDRNGECRIDDLAQEFRDFYVQRQRSGLLVESGRSILNNPESAHPDEIKNLIVKNPLERFLIKGFLEYSPHEGIVRFAPQLWRELRFYELLDVRQNADEQLQYYYDRRIRQSKSDADRS